MTGGQRIRAASEDCGRKTGLGRLMCDECEEIEPLTVAYFGKMERRGWRPPAAARTVPVHDDRVVSGRPFAMAVFACEPADAREVD